MQYEYFRIATGACDSGFIRFIDENLKSRVFGDEAVALIYILRSRGAVLCAGEIELRGLFGADGIIYIMRRRGLELTYLQFFRIKSPLLFTRKLVAGALRIHILYKPCGSAVLGEGKNYGHRLLLKAIATITRSSRIDMYIIRLCGTQCRWNFFKMAYQRAGVTSVML